MRTAAEELHEHRFGLIVAGVRGGDHVTCVSLGDAREEGIADGPRHVLQVATLFTRCLRDVDSFDGDGKVQALAQRLDPRGVLGAFIADGVIEMGDVQVVSFRAVQRAEEGDRVASARNGEKDAAGVRRELLDGPSNGFDEGGGVRHVHSMAGFLVAYVPGRCGG